MVHRCGVVLGVTVSFAFAASPAARAAQRFASPTGSGTACTPAAPCAIETAVNSAASGDEVIVTPGAYTLSQQLKPSGAISLHGVADSDAPVLNGTAVVPRALDLPAGGAVTDLVMTNTEGFQSEGAVTTDRVQVIGGGLPDLCELGGVGNVTMRDSVCAVTTINTNAAHFGSSVAARTIALDNDTFRGAATTGTGVALGADSGAAMTIDFENSIFAGGSSMNCGANLGTISGQQSHDANANPCGFTLPGTGDFAAPALLVDATHGDVHELPGSPTIEAGTGDPLLDGPLDMDGDLRTIGTRDVGADELTPAPAATTAAASAIDTTSATLGGSVNTGGGATVAHFEYGTTTAYGTATGAQRYGATSPAGSTATAALTGLASATTYHYRLVATNHAGAANGDDMTFTTAPPSLPPLPPPITPPSLTPPPSTTTTCSAKTKLKLTIKLHRHEKLRSAQIRLNGKLVKTIHATKITLDLRRIGTATVTLTVKITTTKGRHRTATRRYKPCDSRRVKGADTLAV